MFKGSRCHKRKGNIGFIFLRNVINNETEYYMQVNVK